MRPSDSRLYVRFASSKSLSNPDVPDAKRLVKPKQAATNESKAGNERD